ncbi:MAG: phosphomannomutase [Rhizobiaceae bacterium]
MTSCADIIAGSDAQFGTSGVRGLVEDLDDATCFAYTYGFLQHLKTSQGLQEGSPVWLGMDLRPSSPAMARACLAAIEHAGCIPACCEFIATPALAYSALQERAPAVMITGSHIPFDRNGIKFYRADGEMLKQDEAPIVGCADEFPVTLFDDSSLKSRSPLPMANPTAEQNWLTRYQEAFDGLLKGMVIGHYQHSAAGRDLLATLLKSLGAEVVPLARSQSFVPIDTEAVSDANAAQARNWSRQYGLDALISTDGDGDRPLLADETGTYFRGDTLGILAAKALKASHVVTPVSSNGALEKTGWFSSVLRTKIGSPHVIAAMQQVDPAGSRVGNRIVGFEANGGFLSQTGLTSPWNEARLSPLPTRDSVLPVLSVIALAKQLRMALSQLHRILPSRVTASDRLENTAREKSLALIDQLKQDSEQASSLNTDGAALVDLNQLDGLRMIFANQDVVHIRPSGNAPELRIYVESDSDERAGELLHHARNAIAALV